MSVFLGIFRAPLVARLPRFTPSNLPFAAQDLIYYILFV